MKPHQCPVCRHAKGFDDFLCADCTDLVSPAIWELRASYAAGAKMDEHTRGKLLALNECIVEGLKKKRTEGKPVGYDVEVLFGAPPRTETFHWRGTEAACRRKAIFKPHFQRVISVKPYTSEEWITAWGNPAIRESLYRC